MPAKRQDVFLQAAELAKEADELSAKLDKRDDETESKIKKLREDADKASAADRKRLADIDAEIARLVGPAVGSRPAQRRKRSRGSSGRSDDRVADTGAVLTALKKLGKANAKQIADEIGDDTVPVSKALSALSADRKAKAQGQGRFPHYKAV